MRQNKVLRPRCAGCEHRFIYLNDESRYECGITLKFGKEYCTAGEKYRAFAKKDPKTFPPVWCPKRKYPSEYRVYDFKDTQAWFFHHISNKNSPPPSYRCAVRITGTIKLTPAEFFKESANTDVSVLLGVDVHNGEVVEIDDGLQPYCFHITHRQAILLPLWFPEKAQKNKYMPDHNRPTD